MRGTFGTRYFWGLWNIDEPAVKGWKNFTLGIGWYEQGVEPIAMEIEVHRKYRTGKGGAIFPNEGTVKYSEMAFKKDAIQFDGYWLYRNKFNPDETKRLLDLVKD